LPAESTTIAFSGAIHRLLTCDSGTLTLTALRAVGSGFLTWIETASGPNPGSAGASATLGFEVAALAGAAAALEGAAPAGAAGWTVVEEGAHPAREVNSASTDTDDDFISELDLD
jgi:hypothetical protein